MSRKTVLIESEKKNQRTTRMKITRRNATNIKLTIMNEMIATRIIRRKNNVQTTSHKT